MEALYALRGPSRSMSSFGPILPFAADLRQMSASTPPSIHDETRLDLAEESHIPLPPSIEGSVADEQELQGLGDLQAPEAIWPNITEDTEATQIQEVQGDGGKNCGEDDTAPGPELGDHTTELETPIEMDIRLPVSLLELLEVMEEDKYQSRRLLSLQNEVYGLLHKCGSCDRFLSVQKHLFRRMVECFRSDKKNAFASFYAKAMSYPSFEDLDTPIFGFEDSPTGGAPHDLGSSPSWVQRLPPESQSSLMEFLTNIRTDPNFLADRILKLPEAQLKSLARPHRKQAPGSSNAQSNRSYGRYDPRGFQRSMAKPNDHTPSVDDLMGDPLVLLINGVFDLSCGPRSHEQVRQTSVWSSVCCRLIDSSKIGADDFCITVLNAFSEMSEWPLGPRLELFLSESVATGRALFENPGGQGPSHSQAMSLPHLGHDPLISEFMDRALHALLDLIVADCEKSIPHRALQLIHSILARIENQERRLTARNFFVLRWYCSTFLHDAVMFPETHGLMMDHCLSNNIRQSLLRELIIRLQKVVTDSLSPWSSTPVPPSFEAKMRKLVQAFEPSNSTMQALEEPRSAHGERLFLFLRPEDVLAISRSLSSETYEDSARSSVLNHSSRASSIYGLPSLSGGSTLSGIQDASLWQSFPQSSPAYSQTWHPQASDHRSSIVNLEYGPPSRGHSVRPDSSAGLLGDPEKDSPLPFTHDLWLLAAHRDYPGTGPTRRHEAAVFFIGDTGSELSLSPFGAPDEIRRGSSDSHRYVESLEGIHHGDSMLLVAALSRISDTFRRFDQDPFRSSDGLQSFQEILDRELEKSRSQFDFQLEYFWWNCQQILRALEPGVSTRFLAHVFQNNNDALNLKEGLSNQYEKWLSILRQRSHTQDQTTQGISLRSKQLRNKMWYASDVKHSSAYEDAQNITRALKAMVEPAEQRSNGMAAWARQRIRNSLGHERLLSQTLELMTAPKTYGGPNKLSESQVQITNDWLLNDNVENFCRGEERIHRFCYEIQKCVKRLAGEAMSDSPVLWSSILYQSEKVEYGIAGNSGQRHPQEQLPWTPDFSQSSGWSPGSNYPANSPNLSFQHTDTPSALHSGSPGVYMNAGARNLGASPVIQSKPFVPRNWTLPPSPISPGNIKTSNEGSSTRRRSFLQSLRAHLTSLLLSDLGSILWNRGTETDLWMNGEGLPSWPDLRSNDIASTLKKVDPASTLDPVIAHPLEPNGELRSASESVQRLVNPPFGRESEAMPSYRFSETFGVLLKRFQLSPSPQSKLQYLYELFLLAAFNCQAEKYKLSLGSPSQKSEDISRHNVAAKVVGFGVPRTRLTRLQEVAANCEDRRVGSLENIKSTPATIFSGTALPIPRFDDPTLTTLIESIFANSEYRPKQFFRDLQYIASLTPSSTLDYTPHGAAFWTIGLAAMSVKSAKCKAMTDHAMHILQFHYGNGKQKEPARLRRGSQELATVAATHPFSHRDLSGTTLKDAARLLTVSALEGDPTAARELALFHLTHPELVSRVTLPLSRPSDVFRVKHGGNSSERGHRSTNSEDSGVLDPITFAIVFHWMEFAANAGDADAITFFKENEVLGKAL